MTAVPRLVMAIALLRLVPKPLMSRTANTALNLVEMAVAETPEIVADHAIPAILTGVLHTQLVTVIVAQMEISNLAIPNVAVQVADLPALKTQRAATIADIMAIVLTYFAVMICHIQYVAALPLLAPALHPDVAL